MVKDPSTILVLRSLQYTASDNTFLSPRVHKVRSQTPRQPTVRFNLTVESVAFVAKRIGEQTPEFSALYSAFFGGTFVGWQLS